MPKQSFKKTTVLAVAAGTLVFGILYFFNFFGRTNIHEFRRQQAAEGVNPGTRLDTFVSGFMKRHPDIAEYAVVYDSVRMEFASLFTDAINQGLLEDSPFIVLTSDVAGDSDAPKPVFATSVVAKDSSYSCTIFVTGWLDADQQKGFSERNTYFLKGKYTVVGNFVDEDPIKATDGWEIRQIRNSSGPGQSVYCIDFGINWMKVDLQGLTALP